MAKKKGREPVSNSDDNLRSDNKIPSPVRDSMRRWFLLWGLAGFEQSAAICFSSRMTRAFGRCYVKQRRVVIAGRLRELPLSILEEVLCHECAHLAAVELFGENCRPHGPEWAGLVRSAGFEARRCLVLDENAISTPNRQHSDVYVHFCPVCQAQRVARRVVRAWRCAGCRSLGLDGQLEVRRYQVEEKSDP
jgi:predicted SprT family Zn-dependent metalloprotease